MISPSMSRQRGPRQARTLTPRQTALKRAYDTWDRPGKTHELVDKEAGWPLSTMSQLVSWRNPQDHHLVEAARVFGIENWESLAGDTSNHLVKLKRDEDSGSTKLPYYGLLPTRREAGAAQGVTLKRVPGQYDPNKHFWAQVSGSAYVPMFIGRMKLIFDKEDIAKRPGETYYVSNEAGECDLGMFEAGGKLRRLTEPSKTVSDTGWKIEGRLTHFEFTDEAGINPLLWGSNGNSHN